MNEDFKGLPRSVQTACGWTAFLDYDASYPAYRCENCLTIYGSVGMPDFCHEAVKEQRAFEVLRNAD